MKHDLEYPQLTVLRTIPQTAAALNVGRSTIYELIRQKRLQKVKIGRCTRVSAEAIEHFISELQAQS